MYGVVLWKDRTDNKAVIWCEDHGELAYFNGETCGVETASVFDTGDLVQFDMREDRHRRFAFNPRPIEQRAYAGLPDMLDRNAPAPAAEPAHVPVEHAFASAEIIPFARGPQDQAEEERLAV